MTTKKMEQYDHPRPSPDLSGKRKYPVDSDAKRVMTVDAEQQLVRGQTAHPDMSLTERNVINIVDPKNNRKRQQTDVGGARSCCCKVSVASLTTAQATK
ncbi:hypothetical protein PV325_000588 [Microctonus aethiopoides]|nr:hypothetical protein PV325_000588 [Microctonus aethiopoides]